MPLLPVRVTPHATGRRHGIASAHLPRGLFIPSEDDGEAQLICGQPVLVVVPQEAGTTAGVWACAAWPCAAGAEPTADLTVLLGLTRNPGRPHLDSISEVDAELAEQLVEDGAVTLDPLAVHAIPPCPATCARAVLAPGTDAARKGCGALREKGARLTATATCGALLAPVVLRKGAYVRLAAAGGLWKVHELSAQGVAGSSGLLRITNRTPVRLNLPSEPRAPRVVPPRSVGCTLPGMERAWDFLKHRATAAAGGAATAALIHGPAGVGKTAVVTAFAAAADWTLIRTSPDDLPPVAAVAAAVPVVVLLEPIDAAKGPAAEARLSDWCERCPKGVMVVGTARSAAAVAQSLRRSGRFGAELYLPPPDAGTRQRILDGALRQHHSEALPDGVGAVVGSIATACVGCVAADLESIAAAACAGGSLSAGSLGRAASGHKASLQRAGACMELTAKLSWDDIAGLADVKASLRNAVEWPALHPEAASRFKLSVVSGVLLYGPSGCAKTTLVRALACSTARSLLYLDSAALFASYVGESEALVRATFARARLCAPSCVFIDEIESVCGRRSASSGGADDVRLRMLATLLAELDGVSATTAGDVLFVGATNHPELLDSAIMRPGRFDALVHVPAPEADDRVKIFQHYTRSTPFADDVDGAAFARAAEGFSGADLQAAATESTLAAVRRALPDSGGERVDVRLTEKDLQSGFGSVRPSVTPDVAARFRAFARAHSGT